MARALADMFAIQQTIQLYARAIDRCDETLLRSLFHPDAMLSYGGIFSGSPDAFVVAAIPLLLGCGPTTHHLSPAIIELDGDVARCETYAIAWHHFTDQEPAFDCILGGRHLDRLERREGIWRIAARTIVYDWSRDVPASAGWGGGRFPGARSDATKDARDPLYALLGARRGVKIESMPFPSFLTGA